MATPMPYTAHDLGVHAVSARSLVLSIMLGRPQASMPLATAMALAELFEIPSGTMRTALSRMANAGDIINTGGVMTLGPRHRRRQHQQETGRQQPPMTWNGEWLSVVSVASSRSVAQRREFRSVLTGARFGELRPEHWLRPANAPWLSNTISPAAIDAVMQRGPITGIDATVLVARLWPLSELHERATAIVAAIDQTIDGLDDVARPPEQEVLREAFMVSAAAVRFLAIDPQLPRVLVPADWLVPHLRTRYDHYERVFHRALSRHLTESLGRQPWR